MKMTKIEKNNTVLEIEDGITIQSVAKVNGCRYLIALNRTPLIVEGSLIFNVDLVFSKHRNFFWWFFEKVGSFNYKNGGRVFESTNYKHNEILQIHACVESEKITEIEKLLMKKIEFSAESVVYTYADGSYNACRDLDFLKMNFTDAEIENLLSESMEKDPDFYKKSPCHYVINLKLKGESMGSAAIASQATQSFKDRAKEKSISPLQEKAEAEKNSASQMQQDSYRAVAARLLEEEKNKQ